MKQLLKFNAALLAASLLFASCKKEDTGSSSQNGNSSELVEASEQDDAARAQFDEVFRITLGVQSSDVGEEVGIGSGADIIYSASPTPGDLQPETPDSARCFTVTVEPATLHVFPKTVTLDFGDGCVGKDGKTRKGKIISVYTGPMFLTGNKVTTTFQDYQVDSFKIAGTQVVENKSTNAIQWSVDVTGGKITNANSGNWKAWESSRSNKQIDGMSTPYNLSDDIYEMTGSGSGSTTSNVSWTAEITVPLNWKFSCRWIFAGTVHLTRNNLSGDLNYGDGTCDNKATLTVNGNSYDITLHK